LEWESAQGDSQSQLVLGFCFILGYGGLEQDHNQAAYWWYRSAEQGNVRAYTNIGRCYWKGHGVEQNLVKAVEWFDKAITQGFNDARTYRQSLIDELELYPTEQNQVLGCVQRNRRLKNVRRSMELMPPLGIWAIALVYLFESENKWASLSPAFICLKQVAPALSTMGMKRKRV
jgi:TPR repeat protein